MKGIASKQAVNVGNKGKNKSKIANYEGRAFLNIRDIHPIRWSKLDRIILRHLLDKLDTLDNK